MDRSRPRVSEPIDHERAEYLAGFTLGPLPEELRPTNEELNMMEYVVLERNRRYAAALGRGEITATYLGTGA